MTARALRKAFGSQPVLRGVDFTLQRGENVAVLGNSGTGKSVFIRIIAGLETADGGTLALFGEDLAALSAARRRALRRKVGYLFQGNALYDAMTVRQNLAFPLRRQPDAPRGAALRRTVDAALDEVGLRHAADLLPAELSGGMQKRVALARTLILKPELMLYDEPTTGLDPTTAREISKLLVETQRQYGISAVIVTHDIRCVAIAAHRAVVLRDGAFALVGTYSELEASPDPWVRSFFGEG